MNTRHIINIYLFIRCSATVWFLNSFNPSRNRFIERTWIVSNGILSHYSTKISANRFSDVGGGNLLLAICSKTPHFGSNMLTSGDRTGQGRCFVMFWRSLDQDWTVFAVCIGALSSWNMAVFAGHGENFVEDIETVIRIIKIWTIGSAEYHEVAAQVIKEPPHNPDRTLLLQFSIHKPDPLWRTM